MEGEIVNIRNPTQLLAKFPELPSLGSPVYNNKGKQIGTINWIFGPVDKPIVEVELDSNAKRKMTIMYEKIYVEEIKNE